MATLFVGGANSVARADETLKWRHVQYIASAQTQDVGDINGHVMTMSRIPGIAFFSDGSTGATLVNSAADLTNGSGMLGGYLTLTFSDGSAIFLKFAGAIKVEGTNATRGGTYTVVGGKGRYAGAKGDGTWDGSGAQVVISAMSYIDNVINIKK